MEPVRTCVGCRTRAPRTTLLRVVAQDETLILDDRAVMPGRGAWVHPTNECLESATRRRAFARALRVSQNIGFHEDFDTQTKPTSPAKQRLNGYGNKVNGSK